MTQKISFILPAEIVADAASGVLVGEFNNWNPEEGIYLQKQDDGSMVAELALTAGQTYEYRYLLSDGRWVNDHSAKKFSDVYGHAIENCLVEVPKPALEKSAPKVIAIKKAIPAKLVIPDDLTKIAGIDKKVASLLAKNNICSYSQLYKCSIKKLQLLLDSAGEKFSNYKPATWPKQSKLAANGDWEGLIKMQAKSAGTGNA